MNINRTDKNAFEVTFRGSFDIDHEKNFKSKIRDLLKKKPQSILINLSNVEYIDSTALGLMILTKREANAVNCAVSIAAPENEQVLSILKMTKFTEMFQMK